MRFFERGSGEPVGNGKVGCCVHRIGQCVRSQGIIGLALVLAYHSAATDAQTSALLSTSTHPSGVSPTAPPLSKRIPQRLNLPPRVVQAQRFLTQRGITSGARRRAVRGSATPSTHAQPPANTTWQPLGPVAVMTPSFGLVTGRVSALALDPSDATGNHLYIGTTGGGVWVAQNAVVSNAAQVAFAPLTDTVAVLSGALDASISIGALTVQPGGTGVILAGTGDPNDALDSYYGAGILRSADGGNSWSLIHETADASWRFTGEGFAGFAWSGVNPQLVVAAVSQAYEGTLVNALTADGSYEGLYFSSDSGASWNLATIEDNAGAIVQGPGEPFVLPDGNAATSVVWNPVRQIFVAAVRFHGYYQSADGMTWMRMAAQPGVNLTSQLCPTNTGEPGSVDCPIFRGTLAVNPQTGDTFAWTVDEFNQDQGLWQDQCVIAGGACGTPAVTFAHQWNTQALETSTIDGAATIANGDYNLALAAVPASLGQGEDTLLLAGANDLWKCSLAQGCVWRNTTNATTCMSAQVGEFQHALAWNAANPLEIFAGDDSGLWRSLDAIGETGLACAAADAAHFQNLNGGLGSLAEVQSMAGNGVSQYTLMTGLGVNGTAGVNSGTAPATDWPQILGGDGGPVAIDADDTSNWYVNNQNGVSIYRCSDPAACSPAEFGASPVINDADVDGDGDTMTSAAPFLVDPVDDTQLLIGTCRVWRGPANGVDWSAANAISPILDSGTTDVSCNGDALIRAMAAMPLAGGDEMVYVGTYGSLNVATGGSATLPGHVLSATIIPPTTTMPEWQDLTLNPVTNSTAMLNAQGMDISSIYIDSHDPSGNTVYVTVEGFSNVSAQVLTIYGSTDGGAHWASLTSNLPSVPVSSVVVDPQSASTVYVGTDQGVYFTTKVSACAVLPSNCWSVFGTGLPDAPVVELSASSVAESAQVLTAGTYGRGVWQTPLFTASGGLTTASANPTSLNFPSQIFGTTSNSQTITLTNTGSLPLMSTAIAMSGDFSETDNCQNIAVPVGRSCAVRVVFTPASTGSLTGQMIVSANVYGGQLSVALTGTGAPAGVVNLTPAIVSFGLIELAATSPGMQIEAANGGAASVPITSVAVTPPFVIAANSCGTTALAADSDCQITVEFIPTQAGAVAGTLTLIDGAGTQTATLNGTGANPPTDVLSPVSVSFPATAVGELSAAQPVLLSNTGDLPLDAIVVSISGPFQTSNNCGTELAAHAACTIEVVFAAAQLGSETGLLTVADAVRTRTVTLEGTGTQAAVLSANPGSLTFAEQAVGVASVSQPLTITNTGGATAANIGFQITGSGASSFSTSASTCATILNAASSCTVRVMFTPAVAGVNSAALIISSATAGVAPVTVLLSGAGEVANGLNAAPAQLTFSATLVGSSSAVQTVTVSNNSAVLAGQLTLSATAGFVVKSTDCGASLASGASCTVGMVFSPLGAEMTTGMLTVSSSSSAAPAQVALNGTGAVAAGIQVTPVTIPSFPITGVGQTSSPTTITVTNSGIATALSNLELTVSAGFQLVNNTCTATLSPGMSCTAGVEFAPSVAGAQTGNLTVSSSAAPSAATVPLQGTGFDFTVVATGPNTQSVAAGQTASYTLLLTPLNSSSETFTFTCNGLPADALCAFNPTGVTLNAGLGGNVIVNVSTGSSAAALHQKRLGGWGILPLACGLLLLPLGWMRRRKLMGVTVLLALLAVLVGAVASCASSGGGTGGGGGGGSGTTPTGTYTFPVTATSAGVSHSVPLTVTVD
jgi:hypothetical protein